MMEYTCVDSFCGAGGLGLGLQQAGFDVKLSFDIDKKCIDTIHENKKYFKHLAVVADISDMLNGKVLNFCNMKRENCFFLREGRLVKVFPYSAVVRTLILVIS